MNDRGSAPGYHSNSRFVSGWQCWNKLWWEVHDPDAPELEIGPALRDAFEQGHQVRALARDAFPGGELIDLPHEAIGERVAATQAAMKAGVPAIFEAAFISDDVFVAVDVLERENGGYNLIEAKATTDLKDTHVPDAAIQLHVLQGNGLRVHRTEIMHLDPDYRIERPVPLLVRRDITPHVLEHLRRVPEEIESQLAMLAEDRPPTEFGRQCATVDECPFRGRCWPSDRDHVLRLSGKGVRKAIELMADGMEHIQDLPTDMPLNAVNARQKAAIEAGDLAVDESLSARLAEIRSPTGFLDFETVARAVPVWEGVAPWGAVPVQFSFHLEAEQGQYHHLEWLAAGPGDPREPLARALIDACKDAEHIVTYTGFERTQIRHLRTALPHLESDLADIDARLFDLHALVKNTVYHPDFMGSFSIKHVLPVLVPTLSYDHLDVRDGRDASALLAQLLLHGDDYTANDRAEQRRRLLEYCAMDTWAMVKLLEALRRIGR